MQWYYSGAPTPPTLHIPKPTHLHPLDQIVPITLIHIVVTKCSYIIPVTRVLSEVKKKRCYQCPVTHLYLQIPFWGLLHVCSYRNIRAVDIMYQCVLTLWLHTTYTSSYYASTQVLGPLNIMSDLFFYSKAEVKNLLKHHSHGVKLIHFHAGFSTKHRHVWPQSLPEVSKVRVRVSILLVFLSMEEGSRLQWQEALLDFDIHEEILEKVTFNKLAPDFTNNISQFVLKV